MLGDLLWFEGMEAKTQPEVLKAGREHPMAKFDISFETEVSLA
jgi:hypothetical protein